MSSACRVFHRWSKQHLVETYSKQLIQVSICTRCGQFDTHGISLNSINREEIQKLWNTYHETKVIPVAIPAAIQEPVALAAPAIQAEVVKQDLPRVKWEMPDWMIPYMKADKGSVENLINGVKDSFDEGEPNALVSAEFRGRVCMLQVLKERGLLAEAPAEVTDVLEG